MLAIRDVSEITARCAADAGLTKAVFEMNEKLKVKPWDDNVLPEATNEGLLNCDAVFSYTVTGDIDSGHAIESIGSSGRAKREVSCTLQLQEQGPFEYAIFTQGAVKLNNSATVDWYNYGEDEGNLKVGTNSIESGAVELNSGVIVDGDVVVGAGGDPSTVINGAQATITGDTYALPYGYDLPSVMVPEYLDQMASLGTIEHSITITESGKYDNIRLKKGETITIEGDVELYIVGDLILDNSAELQVVDANTNPDASLALYVGGYLEASEPTSVELKNGSNINNLAKDPEKLQIYGLESCTDMTFKNSSNFYGAIYAPDADVIFHNSAEAFGAVVARSFEQKNSVTFHYDASLRDVTVNDEGVRFVVKRWYE